LDKRRRGTLFESAMKRFEEIGRTAWEIQINSNNSNVRKDSNLT